MNYITRYLKRAGLALALLPICSASAEMQSVSLPAYFHDQQNGTVLDTRKGLYWQKCSGGQSYRQGLCHRGARQFDRNSALSFCRESRLAGKRWRLPTVVELEGLVKKSSSPPALYLEIFSGSEPYEYWSQDSYLGEEGRTYQLYSFYSGYRFDSREGSYMVRCVSNQ